MNNWKKIIAELVIYTEIIEKQITQLSKSKSDLIQSQEATPEQLDKLEKLEKQIQELESQPVPRTRSYS